MRLWKLFLVGLCSLALFAGSLVAQEMVEESSTGKKFPKEVTFTYDGTEYTLQATGTAVRKKYFFKVYGMAHYMQDAAPAAKAELFDAILSDGKAKQITMDFARNVGAGKIQGAYRDGFKKHLSKEKYTELEPLIEQFVGYFSNDVKEDQQYILRWLPGGVVVSIVQGDEKPAITNVEFATALWAIWLGEDSIVKRDKLVSLMAK